MEGASETYCRLKIIVMAKSGVFEVRSCRGRQIMIFALKSGVEHVVHTGKRLRSALQDGALFLQAEPFLAIAPRVRRL